MDYKIKKLENSMVQINLTLDKAEWDKAVTEAYNRTKGKYRVEGFRQGKAPRKVIEKQYGANVFYEEALSEGFYRAYNEILTKEGNIMPVDAPDLNVKKIDENGVELEATVVVMPQVKVNKYTGLDVELKTKKVTKKDVEAELNRVKEQNVRFVEVDREIKEGDVANIDFVGSINDVPFENGAAQGHDLEIGSHSFIEGFEEQLVGLKAGDEKAVMVTFPADYHAKELAGKPAKFDCKVNAVKEKQYPELNDEFASNVSEFETFAEFKAHIEEHLQEHLNEHARVDAENEIIDKIIENTEVDIPAVMVENELDEIMKDMEYRLMYQGLNLQTYAEYMKTTVEAIRESSRERALKSVKVRLILTHILEKEKIDVTDAEVDAKIEEMAKNANVSVKDYKKNLNENRINYFKNEILMSKLLTFLIDKNVKKSK